MINFDKYGIQDTNRLIPLIDLDGKAGEAASTGEAIKLLEQYSESQSNLPLSRYEVIIRYNTGDKIEASFKDKKDCVKFLESYK